MAGSWAVNVLLNCMGLKPGERALIFVDEPMRQAGGILCACALAHGAAAWDLHVLPPVHRLSLVSDRLLRLVSEADVIVSLLGDLELDREPAVLRAAVDLFQRVRRGRWAFGAYVDEAMFQGELLADYNDVARIAGELAHQLRGARHVRLRTDAGTDLSFAVEGRPVQVETGLLTDPGAFGNLPAGEVYIAPLEESADGVVVVDLALGDLALAETVTLRFQAGKVVAIESEAASDELGRRLGTDPWSWTIGEFGVGANPWARSAGPVTVAEKALDTAHIAIGANTSFGGRNSAVTHYDAVMARPQILIDGRPMQNRRG